MEIRRSDSVGAFMGVAGVFLEAREAENNLIFGICSSIEADPSQYEAAPYLATVLDGGRVVGAAIRTPPWRLVVSDMDDAAATEALAADLAGEALPGVVGPARAAGTFAEAWRRARGEARISTHERSYRLRKVIAPRPTPGAMLRATPGDRAVVAGWLHAFSDEAMRTGPAQDWERMADRGISGVGREFWLWVDDGRPVSLTGAGGLTPHGIRVGPVYTPPELRGRGYASSLVAGVSQRQLDAGRRFVFLFTDLANPTANHIYQAIGYEPVIDIDEYAFDA
jgi:predicted GNAT family acetyltransferase